ncbi:hypothetical protein CPB83DRAFT_860788 [Crepidotus variabilis]|uniref:EF-hand domain-containing protein n=1 Tax=Crepidotus variabilis TaxID=179855 RepID=A0A9P6E8M3_9AGAR|nr:hypothetical protein CPB83DRAFT_860788 [Crepidotus variabilis]
MSFTGKAGGFVGAGDDTERQKRMKVYREWFDKADRDYDESISIDELHKVLTNEKTAFDMNTVKFLIRLYDTDNNGSIERKEFYKLFDHIEDAQTRFIRYDLNNSGFIDEKELGLALAEIGFNPSSGALKSIQRRYGYNAADGVSLDHFLRIYTVASHLNSRFSGRVLNRPNWIEISRDDFMDLALNLP